MSVSWPTIRKAAAILLIIWLGTLAYLWLPGYWMRERKEDNALKSDRDSWILRFQGHLSSIGNMSSNATIHVCIASDESSLGGLIALINSIYRNTKSPVIYHLVTDKESFDHIESWITSTSLRHINYELKIFPEEWVTGKFLNRGDSKEQAKPLYFARYYIPALFPHLTGRLIYLEDDCIVQGDIAELYDAKIKEGHVATFSEDCSSSSRRITMMKNYYADFIDFKNEHIRKLGIPPTACSFNTGVFVACLDEWRKTNITAQLQRWMELNVKEEVYGNERGGAGSDAPMMIVFHDNYTHLIPSWHVRYLGWTSGSQYSAEFLSHAKLLHWNGNFKPWGRVSQHTDIWDKYFIQDPAEKFIPVRKT